MTGHEDIQLPDDWTDIHHRARCKGLIASGFNAEASNHIRTLFRAAGAGWPVRASDYTQQQADLKGPSRARQRGRRESTTILIQLLDPGSLFMHLKN